MNAIRKTFAAAVAAATIFAANAASAYERWVYVVNDGNAAIYSVQISHVDDPSFGRDLLGGSVIPSGYEAMVEPDVHEGYCRFDVLITYETGRELTLWGVNLCEATEIRTDGYGYDIDTI